MIEIKASNICFVINNSNLKLLTFPVSPSERIKLAVRLGGLAQNHRPKIEAVLPSPLLKDRAVATRAEQELLTKLTLALTWRWVEVQNRVRRAISWE